LTQVTFRDGALFDVEVERDRQHERGRDPVQHQRFPQALTPIALGIPAGCCQISGRARGGLRMPTIPYSAPHGGRSEHCPPGGTWLAFWRVRNMKITTNELVTKSVDRWRYGSSASRSSGALLTEGSGGALIRGDACAG
jgi:hypothetical protein